MFSNPSSELIFYDGKNQLLSSTIIGRKGEKLEKMNNIIFNNYHINTSHWNVSMIDLGEETEISKINLIAVNDDNYIVPNEVYELFYMDRDGWVSMGVKMATKDIIEFDDVPSGALYWLGNLTKGKEERIFTYEKGNQIWW